MLAEAVVFWAAALLAGLGADESGRIAGVVVSGAAGDAPVAGVEVVLRAAVEGELLPVAETVTDEQGRFVFDDAPIEPGLYYLPGANRHGVHYPGPRIHPTREAPAAEVTLTVYDAVSSPSPLIAEEYELDLRIETGFIEITETLLVTNPTTTAYVGEAMGEMPPITLKLAIPSGFERVTFYDEFHGRRFYVAGGYVATDIPWPPGARKLKFTYRLPTEESNKFFQRTLDLPCSHLHVTVHGKDAGEVSCNLPRMDESEMRAVVFESNGNLTAGHRVELHFDRLPARWMTYARWAALAILAGLAAATTACKTTFRPAIRSRLQRALSQ